MSTFSGISFRVKVTDNQFPHPVADQDGIVTYDADVFVDTRAEVVSLLDKVAIITPKRALGSKTLVAHVDVGTSGTLTVPVHAGQTKSFAAYLVSCEVHGDARYVAGLYWCTCKWIIVGDITP